jgi:cytochrome P450
MLAPMSFPPGPRGVLEVARAFRAFNQNPGPFVQTLTARYGDITGFHIAREPLVFVTDPEVTGEVLLDKEGELLKDKPTHALSTILGQGLLTSEGSLWRRQRKLIAPSLSKKHIASYADSMVRLSARYADTLRDGEERKLGDDMTAVTLDIVVETLFGTELGGGYEEVGHAIDEVMDDFQALIQTWRSVFPEWVPFRARRRTRQTATRIHRIVLDVIHKRRASGTLGDDLLSRLLAARDEADPERGMNDQQLRDEVVTLFMAGHETTSNVLSWTLLLLAEHPEIDARLVEEIERVLGGRPATADDLPKLSYADAIIKEALRIYPPAYLLGRENTRPMRLGRYEVPKGTTLILSPWAMHHDRRHFSDPEAFRPERWLDGSTARLPKHVYMPFGGGPRICVGNHFAMMEAVFVLVTLAQRARFERLSREPVPMQYAITLRPLGGVPLRVRKRAAQSAA